MELAAKLHDALEKERLAETAVEALSGGMGGKRRAWLLPAIISLSVAVVLAGLATVLSNRHRRKDTLQLQAEVARLNGGIVQQSELLRRAEQARASLAASQAAETREALKAQSDEIRQKIADSGDADGGALKQQLHETQTRLSRLENEDRVAETIVHTYGSSICLLHVVVEFHDKDSGDLIRISPDADGKTQADSSGTVSVETGGNGPPLQLDVFGTGFLVGDRRLLTNHHVAEPWWGSDELKQLVDQGASPFVASYTTYSRKRFKARRPASTAFRRMPTWRLSSWSLPRRLTPHGWNSMIEVPPASPAIRSSSLATPQESKASSLARETIPQRK